MSARKFRKMAIRKLEDELGKMREELADTFFNVRAGKEKDYAQTKWMRRDIAVLLTVLKEKKNKVGRQNLPRRGGVKSNVSLLSAAGSASGGKSKTRGIDKLNKNNKSKSLNKVDKLKKEANEKKE